MPKAPPSTADLEAEYDRLEEQYRVCEEEYVDDEILCEINEKLEELGTLLGRDRSWW